MLESKLSLLAERTVGHKFPWTFGQTRARWRERQCGGIPFIPDGVQRLSLLCFISTPNVATTAPAFLAPAMAFAPALSRAPRCPCPPRILPHPERLLPASLSAPPRPAQHPKQNPSRGGSTKNFRDSWVLGLAALRLSTPLAFRLCFTLPFSSPWTCRREPTITSVSPRSGSASGRSVDRIIIRH